MDPGRETPSAAALADAALSERVAEILGTLPDRVLVVDADEIVHYVNSAGRDAAVGKKLGALEAELRDLASATVRDRLIRAVRVAVDTGVVQILDLATADLLGTARNYMTRVLPLERGDDAPGRALVLMFDATHYQRAAANAAVGAEKLKLAIESSGLALWVLDLENLTPTFDGALIRMFGWADDEIPEDLHQLAEHVGDAGREVLLAEYHRAERTGRFGPVSHLATRKDGSPLWLHSQARLVRDPSGVGYLVGGSIDITARRQLEQHVAEAQRLESVARLAGGIAHDFNNMLTIILSYSDSVLREVPADSSIAEQIREVRQAARRSAALTSQLLAFARRQIVEPRVVHPGEIVLSLRRLISRVLGEEVALTMEVHATRRIEIDPAQFEQAIVNLALNARAAIPGEGRLSIEVLDAPAPPPGAPDRDEGWLTVRVRDSGAGIPREQLGRVFEPFFSTKGREGTGLGLAMVHGIVKQAGGVTTIESEVGVGTTVEIHLPGTSRAPSRPEPEAVAPRAGTGRILVVEDEAAVRAAVVRALREHGYAVVEAGNGAEAIALFKQHPGDVDLVVSDVVMPQINGIQLASILRSIQPGVPVLLMSAYTETRIARGDAIGSDTDFLAKPFVPAELVRKVHEILARAGPLPAPSAS